MTAQVAITGLGDVGTFPAPTDYFVMVRVADPTQAPSGTTKKMLVSEAFTSPNFPTSATVTGAGASAFAVGIAGATNPAFVVDTSTALQASGLKVKGDVAAGAVAISVVSSGSNASLLIDAKGTGLIEIGSVSTGIVVITTALTASTSIGSPLATFTNTVAALTVSNSSSAAVNRAADFVRGGTRRFSIAFDASDQFALLAADGSSKNLVVTDAGASTQRSGATFATTTASNVVVSGGGAALATNATAGFLFITSCAGIPSGTPASIPSGTIAVQYDTVNNKIMFFNGSWRGVAVT